MSKEKGALLSAMAIFGTVGIFVRYIGLPSATIALFRGALGVVWIKDLYPRMARLILKIPNRVGKPLTIALCVFMVFNTLMTGACVLRWTQRRAGEPAENRVEAYLDANYGDEKMERIFSNLKFVN